MVNFEFKYNEALRKARDYLPDNPFLKNLFPELRIEQKQQENFFEDLATALRKLWPEGEKDGKYPWRESVKNITARLKLLWEVRDLKDYTLEECLIVARRYIAQFQNNVKYMKTLKYFILRQNEKVVKENGMIKYMNQSAFADMLEGGEYSMEESEKVPEMFEQGELI